MKWIFDLNNEVIHIYFKLSAHVHIDSQTYVRV